LSIVELHIRPLSGALGAEIFGVDVASDLSEKLVAELRAALVEHLVIFFRDQSLSEAQHLTFADRFGEVIEYPMVKGLEAYPKIIPVIKLEHERVNFGGLWHSDMAYTKAPPMGSILVARELPPYGGDTLFANMYMAYDALSVGMKDMLEGMCAVNSSAKADVSATREDRMKTDAKVGEDHESVGVHPVIRTHPESGRKLIYLNPAHTVRFENMTQEESEPLLNYLYAHQTRPEFTCRFSWRPGSIAFWDNRAAQHNPINDYHGHKRVMHRVTLAGDKPV